MSYEFRMTSRVNAERVDVFMSGRLAAFVNVFKSAINPRTEISIENTSTGKFLKLSCRHVWMFSYLLSLNNFDFLIIIIIIIIIIWFGDTVTVSHSTKCDTNSKVCTLLSALQKYLNQKRKTSNQQAKHSNCWGQSPQKISNSSQSDD